MKKQKPQQADLVVSNHGSVCLIDPQTELGKAWTKEHLPADALMMGSAYAVEPRYLVDILVGAQEDGLTVS